MCVTTARQAKRILDITNQIVIGADVVSYEVNIGVRFKPSPKARDFFI